MDWDDSGLRIKLVVIICKFPPKIQYLWCQEGFN